MVATTNSTEAGQKIYTIAGLPLLTAIVCAALFSIAFYSYTLLWKNAPVIMPDSFGYLAAAQDLSDFHMDQLQGRTPGYPILLLLTQSSQSPGRILFLVSLLLHFASVWLLANVLYRAGVRELMLILFAFILLLPPYVEPAAYVLPENLSEVMLVIGLVTLTYWILYRTLLWIIASALAFGYAALTRPTFQLLVLAIGAYFLIATLAFHWIPMKSKDAMKGALTLLCGFLVIAGGYAFLNYRSFGYFVLTPNLGLNLSTKTARFVDRLPDEYAAVREVLVRGRNDALGDFDQRFGSEYLWSIRTRLNRMTGFDDAQLSNYMLNLNLLLIRKAPLNYLQDVVWAFGSYFFPSANQFANLNSRFLQLLWAVIHFCLIGAFALTLILLLGAAAYLKMAMFFVGRLDSTTIGGTQLVHFQAFAYGLAGTIVIYNAVVTCLVEVGDPRHRLPTDALIIFMIFLGAHLWRRLVDVSKTFVAHTHLHAI
jgi:hypothetical protein